MAGVREEHSPHIVSLPACVWTAQTTERRSFLRVAALTPATRTQDVCLAVLEDG